MSVRHTGNGESATGKNAVKWGVTGLIGGGVLGSVLHVLGEVAIIGHLVGTRTERLAWLLLLGIGIVGAIAYYRTISRSALLQALATEPRTGTALGLAFGVLLWFVAIVTVPIWVLFYGVTSTIPYVHVPSLVGLIVYGAVIGGLTPFVTNVLRERR